MPVLPLSGKAAAGARVSSAFEASSPVGGSTPVQVLRGDDDQIVPIGASALLSSKLVKDARLVVYQGAPHGMCSTLKDRVNHELLAFFKEAPSERQRPDLATSGAGRR